MPTLRIRRAAAASRIAWHSTAIVNTAPLPAVAVAVAWNSVTAPAAPATAVNRAGSRRVGSRLVAQTRNNSTETAARQPTAHGRVSNGAAAMIGVGAATSSPIATGSSSPRDTVAPARPRQASTVTRARTTVAVTVPVLTRSSTRQATSGGA